LEKIIEELNLKIFMNQVFPENWVGIR